jgi:hypothetical protein
LSEARGEQSVGGRGDGRPRLLLQVSLGSFGTSEYANGG